MHNDLTGIGFADGNAEMQLWSQVTHQTGDGAGGSLEEDIIKRCRPQQKRVLVTFTCTWSRERTRNGDKCGEKQS